MKPAVFQYLRPTSLEEALSILRDQTDAKVLAGGQSLIPLMNFRLSRPNTLVDISHLQELATISVAEGTVRIGGLVRHQELHENPQIKEVLPVLSKAAGEVGHWAIRNRGTLGGSLSHADPAAELPAAMVALHATLVLESADGAREVPAEEFFLGFLTTDLQPDEIVTAVKIPIPAAKARFGFAEFARRPGDFAVAGAYVELAGETGGDDAVTWFGVSGGPERRELKLAATDAERQAQLKELVEEFDPPEDAAYRKHLAIVVAEDAYQQATRGQA
ncbi:FAD binding domain-containing protein [Alicyclobacillus mengziensis]|uniref:FAD binding domain-containing protein n=1 Tax=Alicyclobacillus mengziensis TaxID=2931921 RepID=A0A9X7VZJ3_9BACL|nr:FAD binding domain-containing protein [Alicyclobacillus mengziensis]QSO47665.1 FAD binding domain-containing protein [Alicyclobacillus mengziensis]